MSKIKTKIFILILGLCILAPLPIAAQSVIYSASYTTQPETSPTLIADLTFNGVYKDIFISFQTSNPELIDSIQVLSSTDTTQFNPLNDGNSYWSDYSQSGVIDILSKIASTSVLGSMLPNDGALSRTYEINDKAVIRLLLILYTNNAGGILTSTVKARQ